MGYFRVHFKADCFLFSQVVGFSAVKTPRTFRGRRLIILSFELLLLVFFCTRERYDITWLRWEKRLVLRPLPHPPAQENVAIKLIILSYSACFSPEFRHSCRKSARAGGRQLTSFSFARLIWLSFKHIRGIHIAFIDVVAFNNSAAPLSMLN